MLYIYIKGIFTHTYIMCRGCRWALLLSWPPHSPETIGAARLRRWCVDGDGSLRKILIMLKLKHSSRNVSWWIEAIHTCIHTYIHIYIYIYISRKPTFRGLEVPWVYPHIISISGSHWSIQPLDGSSCSQWRFISSILQWQRISFLFPYWGYLSSLDHQLITLIKIHDDFQNMMIFRMHIDIKYYHIKPLVNYCSHHWGEYPIMKIISSYPYSL